MNKVLKILTDTYADVFFSEFKNNIKKQFNGDWNEAYQAIFFVENKCTDFDGFQLPPRFHLQYLTKSERIENATEADFDAALNHVYESWKSPGRELPPCMIIPPAFLLVDFLPALKRRGFLWSCVHD